MTTGLLHRLRRPNAWRVAFTGFLLLAFGVQNYVAQTHIHSHAAGAAAADLAGLGDGAASNTAEADFGDLGDGGAKHLPRESSDGCLFCQIVLHGSAPLPQAAAPVLAPAVDVFFLAPSTSLIEPLAVVSHNWQGRGPPST